jgi:hypothetical protein
MEQYLTLTINTLHNIRERLVDHAVTAVSLNPDEKRRSAFLRSDLEQMVEGFFTALQEFSEGGPGPFWKMYIETVIPGILAGGSEMPNILNTMVVFDVLAASELDRALEGNPLRDQVLQEFARFCAAWLSAISSVTISNAR